MGAAQRVSTALLCVIMQLSHPQTTGEDLTQSLPASSSSTTSSSLESIGHAQSDRIDVQMWPPPHAPAIPESLPETNTIPRTPATQPFTLYASDRDCEWYALHLFSRISADRLFRETIVYQGRAKRVPTDLAFPPILSFFFVGFLACITCTTHCLPTCTLFVSLRDTFSSWC